MSGLAHFGFRQEGRRAHPRRKRSVDTGRGLRKVCLGSKRQTDFSLAFRSSGAAA